MVHCQRPYNTRATVSFWVRAEDKRPGKYEVFQNKGGLFEVRSELVYEAKYPVLVKYADLCTAACRLRSIKTDETDLGGIKDKCVTKWK